MSDMPPWQFSNVWTGGNSDASGPGMISQAEYAETMRKLLEEKYARAAENFKAGVVPPEQVDLLSSLEKMIDNLPQKMPEMIPWLLPELAPRTWNPSQPLDFVTYRHVVKRNPDWDWRYR